jgi:hypothetical protein
VDIVRETRRFHVLFLLCDGGVSRPDDLRDTYAAIVEASEHPLSIVAIGIGDGDSGIGWDAMHKMDNDLPDMKRDVFNFFRFPIQDPSMSGQPNERFLLEAMMEVPDQHRMFAKQLSDPYGDKHPPPTFASRSRQFIIMPEGQVADKPFQPPPKVAGAH